MTPPDYDDLCARLRQSAHNNVLAGWQGDANDDNEAADAIAALREQVAAQSNAADMIAEERDAWEKRAKIEATLRLQCANDSQMHLDRALAAEADNAALRKDAERYRFLRNPPTELVAVEAYIGGGKWAFIEGEQVDVTVAAALLAGKKP